MILWIKPTVDGLRRATYCQSREDGKILVQMIHNARPHWIDPGDIEQIELDSTMRISVTITQINQRIKHEDPQHRDEGSQSREVPGA